MKAYKVFTVVALAAILFAAPAQAKQLYVVTSTTDMAALAQEVGGDKIKVESIAKGYQDPHFVEAKPSFLLKLRQGGPLIAGGLDPAIGWVPPRGAERGNGRTQ